MKIFVLIFHFIAFHATHVHQSNVFDSPFGQNLFVLMLGFYQQKVAGDDFMKKLQGGFSDCRKNEPPNNPESAYF
jgi:hypothetical protein